MKKVVTIIISAEKSVEDYRINFPFDFIFKLQIREDKSLDPLNSLVCLPSITSWVLYKGLQEEIYQKEVSAVTDTEYTQVDVNGKKVQYES